MINRVIFVFVFIITSSVFGQNYDKHRVEKGETISQIAQKYKVTPFDIYQLNPDAQKGLKPNSILLIPIKSGKKPISVQTKTHLVEPKETLYGIQKEYDISEEALKNSNPILETTGLQIGQTLIIPSNISSKSRSPIQEKVVYHEVLPKETKYSISKKYGISIAELEKRNPEIVSNLPIGFKLIIKGNPSIVKNELPVIETKKEITKVVPIKLPAAIRYVDYEVKPKETLYSLSKGFGISQEDLIAINPALATGVEIGMILKVPSSIALIPMPKKNFVTLSNKLSLDSRKKLVLLLPFNLSNIAGDTINSTEMRLRKDKFLNMTLDFYSGALMAIDSAQSIGLPIDVSIYDSQETKNASNVAALIQQNNLQSADAIIGPFYDANVAKTAELLIPNEVPVISPLSKEAGNSYPNLYQSIPMNAAVKNAMFDYMRSKGGNVIAVVDKKKESVIQYIQQNHKEVKFAVFLENGKLSTESLKGLFVKDKKNFVLMETANTSMIKATMATMLAAMGTYNVQLVILEPNSTLDTDEINFTNLTKLKLMYPSVTRENESPEALIFKKEYKLKNNIVPTDFAIRGFDLTFDTMLRLSQDKKYQETIATVATEQVDNKFNYSPKAEGGYANKGIYILYYDTDLTIKEAN
jgi:LysM repeat protein